MIIDNIKAGKTVWDMRTPAKTELTIVRVNPEINRVVYRKKGQLAEVEEYGQAFNWRATRPTK